MEEGNKSTVPTGASADNTEESSSLPRPSQSQTPSSQESSGGSAPINVRRTSDSEVLASEIKSVTIAEDQPSAASADVGTAAAASAEVGTAGTSASSAEKTSKSAEMKALRVATLKAHIAKLKQLVLEKELEANTGAVRSSESGPRESGVPPIDAEASTTSTSKVDALPSVLEVQLPAGSPTESDLSFSDPLSSKGSSDPSDTSSGDRMNIECWTDLKYLFEVLLKKVAKVQVGSPGSSISSDASSSVVVRTVDESTAVTVYTNFLMTLDNAYTRFFDIKKRDKKPGHVPKPIVAIMSELGQIFRAADSHYRDLRSISVPADVPGKPTSLTRLKETSAKLANKLVFEMTQFLVKVFDEERLLEMYEYFAEGPLIGEEYELLVDSSQSEDKSGTSEDGSQFSPLTEGKFNYDILLPSPLTTQPPSGEVPSAATQPPSGDVPRDLVSPSSSSSTQGSGVVPYEILLSPPSSTSVKLRPSGEVHYDLLVSSSSSSSSSSTKPSSGAVGRRQSETSKSSESRDNSSSLTSVTPLEGVGSSDSSMATTDSSKGSGSVGTGSDSPAAADVGNSGKSSKKTEPMEVDDGAEAKSSSHESTSQEEEETGLAGSSPPKKPKM